MRKRDITKSKNRRHTLILDEEAFLIFEKVFKRNGRIFNSVISDFLKSKYGSDKELIKRLIYIKDLERKQIDFKLDQDMAKLHSKLMVVN